jgi:hypothetical protein
MPALRRTQESPGLAWTEEWKREGIDGLGFDGGIGSRLRLRLHSRSFFRPSLPFIDTAIQNLNLYPPNHFSSSERKFFHAKEE